jgi:hypothetical protein
LLAWGRESNPSGLRVWEVASGKQRLSLDCQRRALAADFSPDGRWLALTGWESGAYLYDLASGKEVRRVDGHRGCVNDVAFSPDGKFLVTAGEDTTVLVWPTSRLVAPRQRPVARLSAERIEEMWRDLGSADAARAWRAGWALADHPEQAVAFLDRRVPRVEVPAATVQRLIGQLDDDDFAVRQKASRELAALGSNARRLMREALKKGPSLEVERRLRQLLRKLMPGALKGEELRRVRAEELLQRIGTPEARRLLERFQAR